MFISQTFHYLALHLKIEFRLCARGASVVWHLLLPLMNSFNKTEAAVFLCRLCLISGTLFSNVYNIQPMIHEDQKKIWLQNYITLLFSVKLSFIDTRYAHMKAVVQCSESRKQQSFMFL